MRWLVSLTMVLLNAGTAGAEPFPQRFVHVYGETVVPAQPERIVSLGIVGHDHLLALGVVPLALRHWYGPWQQGVWPWAATYLGDARPVVLRGELSPERIALMRPDLILAISSGISAQDYRMLSRIAPTIASQAEHGDYSTPWQVQTLTIGRAVGAEPAARVLVNGIEARLAALRGAHPEWAGQTAVAAAIMGGEPLVFLPGDARADILADLGFRVPPGLAAQAGGGFWLPLSPEDLSALEVDLLIWVGDGDSGAAVTGLALRPNLRAAQQGREIWADAILAGAMGHATPLSLPFVLDRLLPEIPLALDGDPVTVVPSARSAGLVP